MTRHGSAQTTRSGNEADRRARVALTWLADPGNRSVWSMVHQNGATVTLDQLLAGDVADAGLRAAVAARTREGDARRVAEIAIWRADRANIWLVTPSDSEWPTAIDDLAAVEADPADRSRDSMPSLCLWVRGDWSLSDALTRSVAIVGARAATGYGVHVSTGLASGLVERGWTVTSGGAFGIDAAAHRGALTADGGCSPLCRTCPEPIPTSA